MILTLKILTNYIVRHIATTTAKIPPRPKMPTPILPAQMLKLTQQLIRRLPLQPLYQSADRYLWRYRYEKMNVVARNMPLHDLNVVTTTYLADQIPHPVGYVPFQNTLTILGNPHQVNVDHEY